MSHDYQRGNITKDNLNELFSSVLLKENGNEYLTIGEFKTLDLNLPDFEQVSYYHAVTSKQSGKKVFVFCGFTHNVASLLPIIKELTHKGYEIVVICYPGDFGAPFREGLSKEKLAYHLSPDGIAKYCIAVMQAIEWAEYSIIAHSLGCSIVLHMLENAEISTRTKELYLINPFAFYHNIIWKLPVRLFLSVSNYLFYFPLMHWMNKRKFLNQYFQLPLIRVVFHLVRNVFFKLSNNNNVTKANIKLITSSLESVFASVLYMNEFCIKQFVEHSSAIDRIPSVLKHIKFRCIIGQEDNMITAFMRNNDKETIDLKLVKLFSEESYYPYFITKCVNDVWSQNDFDIVDHGEIFSLQPKSVDIDHQFIIVKGAGHEMWLESNKFLLSVTNMF